MARAAIPCEIPGSGWTMPSIAGTIPDIAGTSSTSAKKVSHPAGVRAGFAGEAVGECCGVGAVDGGSADYRHQAARGDCHAGIDVGPEAGRHAIGMQGGHTLHPVELVAVWTRQIDVHPGDPLPSRCAVAARAWCWYLQRKLCGVSNTVRYLLSRVIRELLHRQVPSVIG
jgi:hypothetical protein